MHPLLRYTLDLFGAPEPGPLVPGIGDGTAHTTFLHPKADRQVRLGHAVVAYRFQRARRRTIGFLVGPD
ncbi:MAG: metal-dependent hydrolase, partial [Rhodoferax sp.]